MELKGYEQRRVRELYRRINRNLNQRRRYAEQRGRTFTPDQDSIRKRFYCCYLMDTLDRYYQSDLAFLRDSECWHREEGLCDISSPDSWELKKLLGSSFPEELLPNQVPERDPDEPDEESDDWWEFLRNNANHLDHLEGTGFTGWAVDLYEYKGTYYVFHDAGVDEYDTYREAKKQVRWA